MKSLLGALLLFPLMLTAQAPSRAPAVPDAIREIRESDLRRDLFAMASPAMRGREGGTVDELKASIWVAEQYAKIGLEPGGDNGSWFQWFNIVRTRVSVAASRASIGGQSLELFTQVIPWSVAQIEASGPVLWIADPSDSTIEIRGRLVATTVLPPDPASIRTTSYPANVRTTQAAVGGTLLRLSRRGAAAIILVADAAVNESFDAMAAMQSRGSYDVDHAVPRAAGGSQRVGPVPALGTGPTPALLVRASMAAALRQGTTADLSIRLERFELPSVNVIGKLRGTDALLRDEYLLYSSHQDANGVRLLTPGDSVMAGADDNASVSVAEFAAARAFVAERPKRSLLFVNHGAEERGLLGSRYHAANPVVPIAQIVAVLNGDMIGRNHPDSAALLGSQPPHRGSAELVQMALQANALTGKFKLDSLWDLPTHPEGWFFRSDHLPYARVGIPTLMYTTNLHDDYHTADDTPERIDYAKLTRMAQWMYLTGWYVANAPKRPAVDAGWRLER